MPSRDNSFSLLRGFSNNEWKRLKMVALPWHARLISGEKKDKKKKKKNLIKSCLVPKFHALDFGRLELVCN